MHCYVQDFLKWYGENWSADSAKIFIFFIFKNTDFCVFCVLVYRIDLLCHGKLIYMKKDFKIHKIVPSNECIQDLGEDNAAVRAQQEVKALKKLCEYLQALRQLKQEGELNGEEEQKLENGDTSEEGMDAADAYDPTINLL
jgi:hypothetical protein